MLSAVGAEMSAVSAVGAGGVLVSARRGGSPSKERGPYSKGDDDL